MTPTASAAPPDTAARRFDGPPDPDVPSDAEVPVGRGKSMDHPGQVRQLVRLLVRGGDTTLLAIALWKDGDAATAADIEASVRGLTRSAR